MLKTPIAQALTITSLLTGAAVAQTKLTPEQTFDVLYAPKIEKVVASPEFRDDVILAHTLYNHALTKKSEPKLLY